MQLSEIDELLKQYNLDSDSMMADMMAELPDDKLLNIIEHKNAAAWAGACAYYFCKYKFAVKGLAEKEYKIQLLEDEIKGLREIIEISGKQL